MGKVSKSHTKPFGVDLDPNNELEYNTLNDGDVEVTYKDEKIDYMDSLDIMEERATLKSQGKKIKSSIGLFAGFGEGTLNKGFK
jgi:hypothetical protein